MFIWYDGLVELGRTRKFLKEITSFKDSVLIALANYRISILPGFYILFLRQDTTVYNKVCPDKKDFVSLYETNSVIMRSC